MKAEFFILINPQRRRCASDKGLSPVLNLLLIGL